jgi:hypothetical protein
MVTLLALCAVLAVASVSAVVSLSRDQAHAGTAYDPAAYEALPYDALPYDASAYDPLPNGTYDAYGTYERSAHDVRGVPASSMAADQHHR